MIINVTPHSINFKKETGEEFVVEPSRWLINATASEEVVSVRDGVTFVRTVFKPSPDGLRMIEEIRAEYGAGTIIVGSMIAAQAYPGLVVAMTPAPGYERVPTEQKRMNPLKFTIFTPAETKVAETKVAETKVAEAEAKVASAEAEAQAAEAAYKAVAPERGQPASDPEASASAYENLRNAKAALRAARYALEAAQEAAKEAALDADPDKLVEVARAVGASPKTRPVVFFAPAQWRKAIARGESISGAVYSVEKRLAETRVTLTPGHNENVLRIVQPVKGGIESENVQKVAGFATDFGHGCVLLEGPAGTTYALYGYKRRTVKEYTL